MDKQLQVSWPGTARGSEASSKADGCGSSRPFPFWLSASLILACFALSEVWR